MTQPCTIQGELRLPAAFMHNKHVDEIERQLQAAGLMPAWVQEYRWRLDPESLGGYVLTYRVVLAQEP